MKIQRYCQGELAPNGDQSRTLHEPTGANPRHRARVCGRAQCGGAARPRAAEPEVLVHLPTADGPSTSPGLAVR